ncbi:MAG: class I SAM-dependent methyltransferase [Bryobacteraceae bacterium]
MPDQDLSAIAPDGLFKSPALLERYSLHFGALRASVRSLFELGVYRGGSLQMWRDYFPGAVIAGLDLNVETLPGDMTRIRFYPGSQDDTALLTRIAEECAPEGFDIIIDDCAHVGTLAKTTFWHLFDNHLKPGGIYVIEDWGTGYWDTWGDGRRFEQPSDYDQSFGAGEPRRRIFPSHQVGMPGFLKQLIDECALTDILMPGYSATSYRSPHKPISRIDIYLGQAFVFKG